MSAALSYEQLLDAAIVYLEDLKRRGVQYVPVSAETLVRLAQPVAVPGSSQASQPSVARTRKTLVPAAELAVVVRTPSPAEPQPEARINAAPSLGGQAKAQAMAQLREQALVCQKCPHLAQSRQKVVFGVGDINASLMFVGEAPGADEDRQGEPFVGRAGELLTRIITTMGLSRDKVYIANILKCRPDTPGQTSGNRKPTLEEMKTCLPYLEQQIDLIQPKVLVALGGTAVEGLLGKTVGIMRLRGQWQSYRNIPLMPTFHPSFLLRSESSVEKRKVWEDMMSVMEKLGMPISEKQRGYFLKER